ISSGARDEISQRHDRRDLQLRNTLGRNREIHTLSAGDLQRGNANNLALHIHYRTAARSRRDRRRDLNDATKSRNVAHGGDNSIRNATFQTEWITNDNNALAFLRRSLV